MRKMRIAEQWSLINWPLKAALAGFAEAKHLLMLCKFQIY